MTEAFVVVVTADQRFAQVLCAQASLCGIQSDAWPEISAVPAEQWQRASVAVLNLDEKQSTALPEHVRVLGICRDPEALPLRTRRAAGLVFRRPFSMADFRRELSFCAAPDGRAKTAAHLSATMPRRELCLLAESRCVLIGNQRISLSQKEFDVLSLLVQKGSGGVSKQELDAFLGVRGTNEGQVYICHLRKKLEHATGVRLIQTVRGWGYRLI